MKKNYYFRNQKGLSLVEILVALAIFALVASSVGVLVMDSYSSSQKGGERSKAEAFAQEGIEAVRSIRERGWNELPVGQYGLTSDKNYWRLTAGPDILDSYSREIIIEKACRGPQGTIVSCSEPDAALDLYTKKITSRVTWSGITGRPSEARLVSYLTNWASKDWQQTDWSGGPDQAVWGDSTKYWRDDGHIDTSSPGEIKLKKIGGCSGYTWAFNKPDDYNYDHDKIEVVSGMAQLRL